MARLPARAQPFALLARWDRPTGVWLMLLPALWGLSLGDAPPTVWLLFGLGAVAMRGAGCTINDLFDRKLDAQVARTALRPLASGALSKRTALVWLAVQALVGLAVLLQLPPAAQVFGWLAVPLIAAYPLMKRITWWPQAWLGLTFNWGLWIGATTVEAWRQPAALWFYAGAICWTIAYDTIYALQDRADDTQVGVRSTARLFGTRAVLAVRLFYVAAFGCWAIAGLFLPVARLPIYLCGLAIAVTCGVWLLRGWLAGPEERNALSARRAFGRNIWVGAALLLGLLL